MERLDSKDIEILRDLVEMILDRFPSNSTRIGVLEAQTLDMLHECELLKFDVRRMVDFYKRLKAIRVERRECKDENEIIFEAHNALSPQLVKELNKALGTARKAEEQQARRIYKLRTGMGYIANGGMK